MVGGIEVVIRNAAGDFVAAITLKLERIASVMLGEIAVAREVALFVQ